MSKFAIQACDNALQADPENPQAYKSKAFTFCRWAESQSTTRGQNPEEIAGEAYRMAREAIRYHPGDPDAYFYLSWADYTIGVYQRRVGKDPRQNLSRCVQHALEAVRIDPNNFRSHSSIGLCYWKIGEFEKGIGLDPRNSLAAAKRSMEKAIQVFPENSLYYSNLSLPYFHQGLYEMHHGLDADSTLRKAVQLCEKPCPTSSITGILLSRANLWQFLPTNIVIGNSLFGRKPGWHAF